MLIVIVHTKLSLRFFFLFPWRDWPLTRQQKLIVSFPHSIKWWALMSQLRRITNAIWPPGVRVLLQEKVPWNLRQVNRACDWAPYPTYILPGHWHCSFNLFVSPRKCQIFATVMVHLKDSGYRPSRGWLRVKCQHYVFQLYNDVYSAVYLTPHKPSATRLLPTSLKTGMTRSGL